MKKFKFKLQPVLNFRKDIEEQIQIRLAEALDRENRAKMALQEIIDRRNQVAMKLEEFKHKPIGIDDLIIYQAHVENLDSRITEQQLKIEDLKSEVEEIRQTLLQASRDKKVIEKIKDRQHDRHKKDMLKKEIDFLDEVGTIKAARKGKDDQFYS